MTWNDFAWFMVGASVTATIGGLAFIRFLYKMNKGL